jgi:hypothetical protein
MDCRAVEGCTTMSELKQREGESAVEWLARLRQLDPRTLSDHQRFFLLQHALDAARVAVKRQEDEASYAASHRPHESQPGVGTERTASAASSTVEGAALELCKTAYLALDPESRERFLLWARQVRQ